MADLGREEGQLRERESKILQNLFRLRSVVVSDVMTPRTVVFALSEDLTVAQYVELHGDNVFSRFPVYRDNLDHVTGFILRGDVLNAHARGRLKVPLAEIARPHLEALCEDAGETVFLAIARDVHAIYVDKVVSTRLVRVDAPLGVNRPYNCTSVGKVLLAAMPDEKVLQLAASGAFERRTEHSLVELEALRAELERIREQGWAQDREEYAYGLGCVAAPVLDHEGKVTAALTVSGPIERINQDLDLLVEQVKARAAAISQEMGYRPPASS